MNTAIYSLLGELKPSSTAERDHALAMGLALQFAAASPGHKGLPLTGFAALTQRALQLGQMRVYVNTSHECVGFVIWAMLTPDVESEYIADTPRPLAAWEFSDGTSAWVLDFAVAPGLLRRVMEDLRDDVFKEHEQLTYYRIKGEQRVCKRIRRDDRTSFMTAGHRTQGVTE
jgi:hemolysin-activating ACP:hemolysin acyltransferase